MRQIMALIMLLSSSSVLASPAWIEQPPKKVGNIIQVTCHGSGPDQSTAFQSAINECRAMAASYITQDYTVTSVTVQTEKSAALHEEVSAKSTIKGLDCKVKESFEEGDTRWLQCDFDVTSSKATSENIFSPKSPIVSENTQITLSSVPSCDSIMIVGKPGRIVSCQKGPTPVLIKPGDSELVVRAEGFQPKHLPASSLDASVVYLERN